jgi:uncharacterized membrane protein YhaH (DUF805 family)
MADLNLRAAFIPAYRAGPDTYWLGLGVIALIDAVRLTLTDGAGMLPWLFILFFTASININRLRDAGRQPPLAIIPLAAGVLAKSITALFTSAFIAMDAFLVAQGVDTGDSAQVMGVVGAPDFQTEYQSYLLENPDVMAEALQAAAWASTWAYWLAVGAVALWFARMRPRPRAV